MKFNLSAMVILVFLILAPTRAASTSAGIATKVPYEKVVKRIRKVPPNQISHLSLNPPQNRSLNLSNTVAIVLYEAWRQLEFKGSV